MDFVVGVSRGKNVIYPSFDIHLKLNYHVSAIVFFISTDQQITWDGIEVDLDPKNPEKPVTSQNK